MLLCLRDSPVITSSVEAGTVNCTIVKLVISLRKEGLALLVWPENKTFHGNNSLRAMTTHAELVKSYLVSHAYRPLLQGQVIESIVVLGLPPQRGLPYEPPPPEIAFQIWADSENSKLDICQLSQQLPSLCFPDGVIPIVKSEPLPQRTLPAFVFQLSTSSGSLLYGYCMHQYEPLDVCR